MAEYQQQQHFSTQSEPASADQSSQEIHALIQKLDQSNSTHKDRVRRITRFRNYVSARPSTPEFYDDDIPLLLLGRNSTSAGGGGGSFFGYDLGASGGNFMGGDEDGGGGSKGGGNATTKGTTTVGGGLLHACGAQSQDHGDLLKRSARYAMSLLKYLVCDHREYLHGSPVPLNKDPVTGQVELNMFAHALCSCTIEQLSTTAKLHWHLEKGESSDVAGGRSGAKAEACAVLVLLLTRHLSPDGFTEQPLPLQALLPTVKSRKIFDAWLTSRNGPSKDIQKLIKKQQMLYAKLQAETSTNNNNNNSSGTNANNDVGQDDIDADTTDVLSSFRKNSSSPAAAKNTSTAPSFTDKVGGGGVATKWSQSQLNNKTFKFTKTLNLYLSEKGVLEKGHVEEDIDDASRLRQQQQEESKKREEEMERKKLLSRDPLGVYGDDVDIQYIQKHLSTIAQKILDEYDRLLAKEVEEEQKLDDAQNTNPDAIYRKKALTNICTTVKKRREAFLASIAPTTGSDDNHNKHQPTTSTTPSTTPLTTDMGSILTTDPNFKPMLFLSLVHKDSLFDQLKHGSDRLECRTDNQIFRLQNLVRDNFALFLRCANGINLFEYSDTITTTNTSSSSSRDEQRETLTDLMKRFDKMDKLSNTCVRQANNSFTSLLENTTDVRKTQSALSVLERMKPLLEVPSLMKNHLEAGRFTGAVNAYRRVLTIKEDCQVELLKQVKQKATELCHLAQRRLEQTIADPSVNVSALLDAIRDLRELQSLNAGIQRNASAHVEVEGEDSHLSGSGWKASKRALEIVRTNPPALACLLLQSKHFANLVDQSIEKVDSTILLISQQGGGGSKAVAVDSTTSTTMSSSAAADSLSEKDGTTSTHNTAKDETISSSEGRSRWRYDILDARVAATIQAISVARTWLPRLVRIGVAAHEAEKREPSTKQQQQQQQQHGVTTSSSTQPSFKAYDVYAQSVFPAVIRFVEHATFCSLGCGSSGSKTDALDIPMSFGKSSNEKIQALLKAPLPPALSAKCAAELAELVDVVYTFAISAGHFRRIQSGELPTSPLSAHSLRQGNNIGKKKPQGNVDTPLIACVNMAEHALITAERRRCIFALDACGRSCAMLASSRGVFDADALLQCVKKLSEEVTRPQQCAREIERGCQLAIRRSCEGLASYVKERGTSARLRTVSVCANAISGKMVDIVREISFLTGSQSEDIQELLSEDIESLERVLFDEFLDGVTINVTNSIKLGLVNGQGSGMESGVFPSYLSSSLLAITRCRAQVEKALGDTLRRTAGKSYQEIAVVSASETLVNGLCDEITSKTHRITTSHAERLANELQFILNTLKKHVDEETTWMTGNSCLQVLCKKAGRGDLTGPVDLGPVEELERLGRVYVLCLAD